MFKTLDRYLIREITPPLVLALVVLTFVLEIPPILLQAEQLVAKGLEWSVILRVLLTLLPQALSLTIPMAVLLGVLIGLGRLSADREVVALHACGVSPVRLWRPVALVAILGTAATAYETIVALPNANQTYREIVYVLMASRIEGNVKPRVFYEDFPNRVIYVRDVPAQGSWRDVFLADTSKPGETTVYLAKEARILLDPDRRLVQLELVSGTGHTTHDREPDQYEEQAFDRSTISLDPDTVFRRSPPKGPPEMTFAELRQTIADAGARGDPAYNARFMVQYKLSLPATCPILALIALALGMSSRKDGRLAGFVLGVFVVLAYYILLYGARALAMGGRITPELAPWAPNVVMLTLGIAMFARRVRGRAPHVAITVPSWIPFRRTSPEADSSGAPATPPRPSRLELKLPTSHAALPRLLDLYLAREYVRIFLLGVFALLAIFYISTFIDMADKLFRGAATSGLLVRFLYYQTPQFVYYVIPMAVLVATLVTLGLLTRTSELLVMRACGISLYRTTAPLLLFGTLASATLFGIQEQLLALSNREADRLNRIIRNYPPPASGLNRHWVVGREGDIYHYDFFDATSDRFSRLWVYQVGDATWQLSSITYAASATYQRDGKPVGGRPPSSPIATPDQAARATASQPSAAGGWRGHQGWTREFRERGRARSEFEPLSVRYGPFTERPLAIEPPAYFENQTPDAEQMTYGQLSTYIDQLRAGGAYAVPYIVALQRKVAFPFVTVIMTALAIPFAVFAGPRSTLYGIGVGIALAIVYWVTLSICGALGAGGVLPPMLAAWAPNIVFGAAALSLLLTVRS